MTGAGPVTAQASPAIAGRPPLWFIYSITLTGILANVLITAPLPDILAAFGEPDSSAGLVVSAATVPGIVMAPIIGVLADRYGRRPVLVPCLVVFGIFGVLAGLAPTFGLLLVCRLAQGVGSAGLINLAVVLIGDHWDGAERVRLIGRNAAVLTVSIALLPGISGVLDQIGGWRWSFAPYGFALVTAAAAMRYVPRGRPAEPPRLWAQVKASASLLRRPIIGGTIGMGFVLFALIFGLFLTAMPILLEDEFGLEPIVRGLCLAAPAVGSTAAALLLGRTRHRLGARRLLLVAAAFLAVGFAAIGATHLLVVVLVGAMFYGLGEGSTIPTAQDLVAGGVPPEHRAALVAVWVGAARAGQSVGPLGTAALLSTTGIQPLFVAAGAVCAVLSGVIAATPQRWYPDGPGTGLAAEAPADLETLVEGAE